MRVNNLNFRDGKDGYQSVEKRGETLGVCATFNKEYLCCNVHVLRSVHNCPFECSYCFLQNYLTDGLTKVVGETAGLMSDVKEKTGNNPDRFFRIGTWELGDSLALESRTGQAAGLIQEFASLENAVLELKTKSDRVDSILGIKHGNRTVVSWSLNTEHVISEEERGTASLEKRIKAMKRAYQAGYLIGLHFDPMIIHDGWKREYEKAVDNIFSAVSPDRVAWISIGSLRFNPEMKRKIENNYPESGITSAEMVAGDDAKVRYVKPLRFEMYRHLYSVLKKHITEENLVYLCMERWDVWEKVFGWWPESIEHLDYIFAKSLYNRYGLGVRPPLYEDYNPR
jgi:spore photoproduct lyase